MEPKSMTASKISQCNTCHRPRKFFDKDGCDMTGCPLQVEAIALALVDPGYVRDQGLTLNEYQRLSQRTAKPLPPIQKFWHGAQGCASDGGEVLDIAKANQFYEQPIDREHAIKELGDVLWFVQEAAMGLGCSLEEVARRNIAKLAKRYPEKFTNELAIARLDGEKK